MNLAKPDKLAENPIDIVENILSSQAYELERRSANEVVMEFQGKWNEMLIFFSWEASMQCLHITCIMNIENQLSNQSNVFELLAMVNENLWVGHFSYWREQKVPVFRHSLFFDSQNPHFVTQLSQLIDIAIKECERMYPIFNVVLTKGMNPKQALYPHLIADTFGNA